MERLVQLQIEHKNCSVPYCKSCTAIAYFHKKDYYMSISYFYQSEEFDILDMLIFKNYMEYTKVAIKNEFIVSWLIGVDLYRNKKYDQALKYIKYASDVDNVKSAHHHLGNYYKNNNNIEESIKYYCRYIYLYMVNEEDCDLQNKDYNIKNLIFTVSIYYLDKNDTETAYKISNFLDKSENWISAYLDSKHNVYEKLYKMLESKLEKDIVQYHIKPFLVDYIQPFLTYSGKENIYQSAFETVLEKFETEINLNYKDQVDALKKFKQPLLSLYNKACVYLGDKYKEKQVFNKAVFWYEKAYDYVKITEYYIKMRNKENVYKYSELAIQNRQYKIYHRLIDFHIKEREYEKALSAIKVCFEQFETFSKGIYDLYEKRKNIPEESKKQIFRFVEEFIEKLENIEDDNDFYNIPIRSEDVSPLFYMIAKFYESGFGIEKNERQYKKYMKLGNKWANFMFKYNPYFGRELSDFFCDDKNFKGYNYDEDEYVEDSDDEDDD